MDYKVVKNTLTRFAAEENGFEGPLPYLTGPTSMASSDVDPVALQSCCNEYAKKFEKFELKAGVVEGRIVGGTRSKPWPSAVEGTAHRQSPWRLQCSISGFVNVLNANIRGLVVALNAIAEKKASA